MYLPDRDSFRQFVADAGTPCRIVVRREILADLETPVSAYMKLRDGGFGFLFESVEGGEDVAHYSFIGTAPRAVATFDRSGGLLTHAGGEVETLDSFDPLKLLERELAVPVVGSDDSLPAFLGGAVGYLAYECAALWEKRVPIVDNDPHGIPGSVLMFVDTLLAFDHLKHRALVVAHALVEPGDDVDAAYNEATARIDAVVDQLAQPLQAAPISFGIAAEAPGAGSDTSNVTPERFRASVDAVKEHIVAGDIIQAVVSQRFSRPTPATPLEVYRALRTVDPAPYMYLLELEDTAIVGASPELLVRVQDGRVTTHPIAGTRPRGETPEADLELERELLADPKERAEHVMLVDLGRNDLGRICTPGSVEVSSLMHVERYSHVMHIVSNVTGVLDSERTPLDAVRSCFPAGTVSGAPKIRAQQIIAELEPDQRGTYAGAVGYFGYDGNIDTAITIRTLLMNGGVAHAQAGAGIVADSDPQREYDETRSKARGMLCALDVAESFRREESHAAAR